MTVRVRCVARPMPTPPSMVALPYRQTLRVVWREVAPELLATRAGAHAQARAPPSIS
jgi:hypothetical protein